MAPKITRNKFLVTYNRCQIWSLPDSIIYYITKYPSSSNRYQKMVQSCKHFFIKNPIIVTEKLHIRCNNKISIELNKKIKYLSNISNKLWITFDISTGYSDKTSTHISSFIPKLYRCDATYLTLTNQNLSFSEFLFLSSNVKHITLSFCVVKNEDGSIVPLEEIVAAIPKIKVIFFHDCFENSSITKNTVKEILKIPHFTRIEKLEIYRIPESFDIEIFFQFIEKNIHIQIYLNFNDQLSEAYKNRLEAIVDKIIATENYEYKVPVIDFGELPIEKYVKMCSAYRSANRS